MISWLVLFFIYLLTGVRPESCMTPDHVFGQCKRLLECSSLWELANRQTLSRDHIYFLRKSACGFDGTMPMVCCENEFPQAECKLSAFPPDPRSGCCGRESINELKKRGHIVKDVNHYPWWSYVHFQRTGSSETFSGCDAVLISGKYAVTIAEFFTPESMKDSGKPTVLVVGENVRTCEEENIEGKWTCINRNRQFQVIIDSVIIHPKYDRNHFENDIALIRLSDTIQYSLYIRPICLPTYDVLNDSPENLTLTVPGWIIPKSHSKEENYQKNVIVPVVNHTVCKRPNKMGEANGLKLANSQICIHRNSCTVTSGEPLQYDNGEYYELVGMDSFGPYYASCNHEDIEIYTKIFSFKSWMLLHIKP